MVDAAGRRTTSRRRVRRGGGAPDAPMRRRALDAAAALVRRVMPLPTARERRLALRLRASELVGLLEATDGAVPEAAGRPRALRGGARRRSAARPRWPPTQARAAGLDPLTFRSVALDTRRRARTCSRSRRCRRRSATRRSTPTSACPLQYAFQLRLPDPRADRPVRRAHLRHHRPRGVRGVHPGAPRAGRRAASRRRPARTSSGCSARAGSPTAFGDQRHRGGLPAARRDPARQLLGRRGRVARRGDPRGAATSSCASTPATAAPPVRHPRLDRPDRPAAVGRHRGHRLQDRQRQQPEGRRREPPAVDLRARLPRRAGPRHARAGDALLHRVGDAAEHDPDGRAARRRPRRCPARVATDPRRRLRGDAGQARASGATIGRCARSGCRERGEGADSCCGTRPIPCEGSRRRR